MSVVSTALDENPVRALVGSFTAAVNAGLIAATALDWVSLTAEQTAAVLAFITAGAALVTESVRSRVYAPATVRQITAQREG